MSELDPKLVDRIVQQVIGELKRMDGVSAQPTASPESAPRTQTASAPVTPLQTHSPNPAGQTSVNIGAKPDGDKPLKPLPKVFITAEMLERRLDGESGGKKIELAHNEFLTPAAQDVVDEKHLSVSKAAAPVATKKAAPKPETADPAPVADTQAKPKNAPTNSASPRVALMSERTDASVDSAISGLAHDGLDVVDYNQTSCWMSNLQALCNAVASGNASIGVAVLPYAADAMLLAAKFNGIRPVQGTRPESVSAALRHYDANVLIVEHAFSTFHEIRTMVRSFATQRDGAQTRDIIDAVEKLENA